MMKPLPNQAIYHQQARVLKALANESRLLIVDRLSRGDCSAGELTRFVGLDQTTVSKHLAALRAHGIVMRDCFQYYHEARTHLGLEKDAPIPRDVEPPERGPIHRRLEIATDALRLFARPLGSAGAPPSANAGQNAV